MNYGRMLRRGESLIAFAGIGTPLILIGVISLAGWWTAREQQEAWRFVRTEQIRTLASVIAPSAEAALHPDRISDLRRLLVKMASEHDLSVCRIVLLNGDVIADGDPKGVTRATIPEVWPSGPLDAHMKVAAGPGDEQSHITVARPLFTPGRGAATLQIAGPVTSVSVRVWQMLTAIGLIGAAGLGAMLLLYRRMRSRVATLEMVRESLLGFRDCGASTDVLLLRDSSLEARVWNDLLAEHDRLRKTSLVERVEGSLGNRREGRSELENAYDALAIGLVIVDAQARVKHVNGAAAVMLRQSKEQMADQPITELISDPQATEAVESVVSRRGHRRMLEIRRSEAQGGGIIRLNVRPMRREDSGAFLITIEDVTQQRVADAARNSFVAQATHELRTPLTNMRLCLEDALEDDTTDPKAMREQFNVLNKETRRLERMVGEMLSMAQIEAGALKINCEDVRQENLWEELRADYAPQALDKQILLTFDLPPKFPVLHGDRDKLMVVLHNLLGNALKYTPPEGKVSVAVRVQGAQFIVEISDSGIGIAAEEQPNLFQRFYRAKDPRLEKITGSGLGLALAREIARLHGGDITLQSELNHGSVFTLMLPLSARAQAA